ncbi:response regulator transcription factor [Gudongella sp. DL1XJH-153]|uniref:response regulator transcription factor n=1 Tax=Gudongella sp. DL1XJH-153 TaxID=3409804 RepID=UPI003BB664E2
MRILIAEDEKDLLELLQDNLSREGHDVFIAENGKVAWEIFEHEKIELCILDVMMPEMDGLKLVQKIREKSETPVIFLTARGDETDKVLGLSLGGDDYLVKPFSMAELKARVQVQARHIQKRGMEVDDSNPSLTVLSYGKLNLHLDEAVCYKNDQTIILSAKEFLLLKLFMENVGRVFTKKQIYNAVWQEEYLYDDNTVMVHLSRLRSKIEDDPKNPIYLITIRGIGYKFSVYPPVKAGEVNAQK